MLAWYQGYAEKSLKKPLQIKQQIDSDIIPLLGKLALDKIQTIDISKALDKIVERGEWAATAAVAEAHIAFALHPNASVHRFGFQRLIIPQQHPLIG